MQKLEADIKEYLEERGWDNLRPGDIAKSISIESGELLELFQWDNPALDDVKKNPEKISRIQKELADIMTYCLDMSVLLHFDTEAIIREKLEYVKKKYPAELMKNEAEVSYPGSENYWRIKKEYRKSEQS